ncbi:unnamed protein product [Soboliphyme baturini]|uniref:Transposase n=1 Tax=Soboliphyme baturini TaxID=241478 RepID=A0A183IIH2_9BILA|nr:unnamed protein product [Soboliphyme baturini]
MIVEDKSLLKSYLMELQIAKHCPERKGIPISASTVKSRIEDMAEDTENHVIAHVESSAFYSIQFDESTDITNK